MVGTIPRREALEKALQAIQHRGPDGEGLYLDEHAGLVHARLSIIDLSPRGQQPMKDDSTGVVIVFNGEVYNYRELKSGLGGAPFRSDSDTEVVLRLYLRHGMACAAMLRGMFAFAIWDPRSQALHLCRDRFGIKPIYYNHDGQAFLFSSEIKGLLALGAPIQLNRRMVYDYLQYGRAAHTSETFFDCITCLEPATILSFCEGHIQKENYWSPLDITLRDGPRGDVEEELWGLLQEALRLHMVSDVPIGISLSSGLDSQFIVRMLSQIGQGEFHTFTFGYDEPEYDEIIRVQQTKFSLPLTQHYLRLRPPEMLESLQRAIRYFEAPLGGLGTLSAYRLMEVTHDVGIKVLLSGEGSDEIFGGYKYYYYSYFRDLYERQQIERLEVELAGFARTNGESLEAGSEEFRRRVLNDGVTVRAPDGTSLGGGEYLGPGLLDWVRESAQVRAQGERNDFHGHLRKAMLQDLVQLKVPKLLWFQDRASMAWGIETRVSFLDHKLAEFVYSLPAEWIIRDGVSKYLLKRLLKRFGGLDYSATVKHYVATPQREWLKGPLYEAVTRYMDEGCLANSGLVDYTEWKQAYSEYAQSPELGNSFFVWKMVNLEALLREFFGGKIG